MEILKNYINGNFIPSQTGNFLENKEPATGKTYSKLPDSNEKDMDFAIASAKKAFEIWSETPSKERCNFLLELSQLIDKNLEELAYLESKDQGKPFWLAKEVDIPRASDNFRFFASSLRHEEAKSFHDKDYLNYTSYEPSGVCGLISPWNLPLYLLTWKIAPCLALGNTAVCKPSELTPMTAFKLAELMQTLDLPKGVCNFIFGTGEKVGRPLVKHKDVPVISFTGGGESAKTIIKDSSEHYKKLGLELGGKNPSVIFADCDLEKAVSTHLKSSFLNQGEICLCTSRIYVEEGIYDAFVTKFREETSKLTVGPSSSEDSFMGALISKEHLEKVLSYVKLAKEEGARVLTGGEKLFLEEPYSEGYYMRPTIIEGLRHNSRVVQEEIFGPVTLVFPFKNLHEALELANDTKYGLAATVWTKDIEKAHRFSKKVKAGQVWVNSWLKRDLRTPFGGMKASGVGREGGYYSHELYCDQKNVGLAF